MNQPLANEVLKKLFNSGVRDLIVCAGARNAPFVKSLTDPQNFNVHYFFDERAASFFALGRAKRDLRPVAVITTSGTAAAELLPATVEAYYSGVPLVLVTADRPKNFRGRGAPQAIEQVGLFSHYTPFDYDLDHVEAVGPVQISPLAPTHINVCFGEPL